MMTSPDFEAEHTLVKLKCYLNAKISPVERYKKFSLEILLGKIYPT